MKRIELLEKQIEHLQAENAKLVGKIQKYKEIVKQLNGTQSDIQ